MALDPAAELTRLRTRLPKPGRATSTLAARRLLEQSLEELETRAIESRHGGLRLFVERAWPILEPAVPFAAGYHVDAICAHLEAMARGEIRDLLILIPPRFGKSLMGCVFFPAWIWGPMNRPSTKWMFNTYRQDLSLRDSGKRRSLMSHAWFQHHWGDRFSLGTERFRSDSAVRYENDRAGFHLATSVGGGNIGEGGDFLIADDANNLNEIHSEIIREAVIRWWCEIMATRRNNAQSARLVIQQRGHERDLAGAIIALGGYEVLRLPNEYDPRQHCSTRWWTDPRREPGELLCPERLNHAQTAEMKVTQGEMAYEAQFQQNPVPPAGGILKEQWWRYWVPAGHPLAGKLDVNGNTIYALPKRFQQRIQTWDMTFKKTLHGSYVCGQAWGRWRALAFLLGQFRERVGFVDTVAAVKDLCRQFPSGAVYVEGKANGPAVIDTLRLTIPGLIDSDVEQDKVSRAHAASPRVQAGNFVLPHPDIAPWVRAVISETKLFPNAANDDIVDTITMADRYLFIQQPFTEKNFAQGADHGI